MKLPYFLPVLLLIFITSCKKEFDIEEIIEDDIVVTAPVFVETDLFVKISGFSSEEGLDAICIINDVEYKPDVNGFLYIPSILMNQQGQLVKVNAVGFMPSIFSVIPSIGDVTQLKARVFESRSIETFDASVGGTLAINNSEYTVPALSVVDANGDVFLGTVNVESFIRQSALYASLIPSFSHNILIGDDGKNYSLQTWGGHDIFLYDVNGNEVYIDEEVTIQARLSVETIGNNAIPDEFEVMRFNDLESKWKIDSEAKIEGEKYTTEISGFGHLRWSRREETRLARVKFTSESGPLTSVIALVFMDDDNPISVTSTNDIGYAYLHIPVSGFYTITTLSLCGTSTVIRVTYEEVVGNEDVILDLKDYQGLEKASKIQGKVVDCTGNVIPEGILEISSLSGHYFIANEDGMISSNYYFCVEKELSGRVYNPTTQEYSDVFKFEYIPSTTIELGDQMACQ